MNGSDRRRFLTGFAGALALSAPRRAWSQTRSVVDGGGREVRIPERVTRIFPAGPPAAILIYTLAPGLLIGWPRANRPAEREFLLPEIGGRPEVGRLTGRGNSANLEQVLALKPDLIVDVGSTQGTFVALADRVATQTGVPYALIDGRLAMTPESYRLLGALCGREAEGERLAGAAAAILRTIQDRVAGVPEDKRPKVYFARGPRGLETGLGGSINVESIEAMGARNVAAEDRGGLATVSLEQVLRWDPEVIVTIEPEFARAASSDPNWAGVKAVRDRRVHLAPKLPFGWIDFPPSVNRLVGLWWLGKALYPALFPEDLRVLAREFFATFYHVTVSEAAMDGVLAGREP